MWNGHMFIRIRKTFTNVHKHIGIRKTRNWFRYETFYYLFEFKVFRHEERETQFLSMLTFLSDPATCSTPPQTTGLASASSENQLLSSSVESQLTVFFQIPKSSAHRFRAWRHSRPRSFPIWGFYCDICDCHILPACAWTPALNVCT